MGNFISYTLSASSLDEKPHENECIGNPGSYEELHKVCKEVFPVNFEGARLIVNKGLSKHFQISHSLNMSSTNPSGYKFGATYVGTNELSPNEAFPLLLGEIDPSGNLNAHIVHKFNERLMCKYVAQVQNSMYVGCQFSTDYRAKDYTASLTLANVDVKAGSGVAVAHLLQSVTPRLALGSELMYQYGAQVPGGQVAVVSLAARYRTPCMSAAAAVGMAGVNLSYWQRCSEQLQLGCEFQASLLMQEAVGSVGYQVDIPGANLVFRGTVDSNWSVGAVLEKKLAPLPFTFALSGLANQAKSQYRFGCSLMIG